MKKLKLIVLSLAMIMFAANDLSATSPKKEVTKFQKETTDGGYVIVSLIEIKDRQSDILLTKTNREGKEEWSRIFGGTSYERVESVIPTNDGGYAILGGTSSFGKGNYDIYLIKTDDEGREVWTQTYGGFYNEYGHSVSQTEEGGYLIKGKKQICKAHNDWSNCEDKIWIIQTDKLGNMTENRIGQKEE